MLRTIGKKEQEMNVKELIKFCKNNHCDMWNYMLDIKSIRVQGTDEYKAKVREAIRHLEGLMIITATKFGQVNEGAERYNKAIRMCQRRLEKELKL